MQSSLSKNQLLKASYKRKCQFMREIIKGNLKYKG